ncbi:uncharacterized protein [Diadema antillarum]|uniref:uncharacterized protein n=1 Tax=Diadema antillarum TaxID=105358 RepID=UPI003A8827EC
MSPSAISIQVQICTMFLKRGEVFEQSFDDVDLVVPTLDSGYRTATSLTQGLVPVKNGQRPLTHSPPQHLSAIIDALALDVFQKADRPLPFGTSPSLPPQFLTFCPHCKYHQGQLVQEIHVGVDHNDFPRKLYDGDINTVDSSNGDIGCDSPSDTGISHEIGIQTDAISVSEKETSCAESAVLSSCHVALQTESVAVISESLGTQTVPESVGPSWEKPPSVCREVQCQAVPTFSQGVLARVVLKNAQSQTKSEERPPAIQQNTTSQTELSSRDLIAKQSTACIATQTLPQSSTKSLHIASDVSIPVPPPPSDHQTKSRVPSALTLPSSNYLLPSVLPNRVLSEDWDSDISADSPSFVSALSSPVNLSPLPFGKTESTQPAIPTDIETVSFKPIVPHRERMEQAVPAPIDENSNTELNPEIESQKMQVERCMIFLQKMQRHCLLRCL